MNLVLDCGALIALERNERSMWRRLKGAMSDGTALVSHGGVVGQAWRGREPRQALLARALDAIEVRDLGAPLGRAAGELLATSGADDVIDAALVLVAADGDTIVTSDVDDLEPLAACAGLDVEVVRA